MKTLKMLTFVLILFTGLNSWAQNGNSEEDQIRETLMHYIEGTANGEPDRLRKAFHPDFNLYAVSEDGSLRVRSGEKYISLFKKGQKADRVGKIVSIDYENDAATAKVEIVFGGKRVFTDYFLLLKYEGSWKIVHKSYTSKPLDTSKN